MRVCKDGYEEKYSIKATECFFFVFTQRHLNSRLVGRILKGYVGCSGLHYSVKFSLLPSCLDEAL